MPGKRIDTGSKPCESCGVMFARRANEALWQFFERCFCSKSCARRARNTKSDDQLGSNTRYRRVKINGKGTQLHRRIIESHLGRPLLANEMVHHIDGNGLNNDISNLQIVTPKEHSRIHLQKHAETWLCATCGKPFTPHKTKRGRKKNCSPECFREYQKRSRGHYVPQQVYPFFEAIRQTIRHVCS